MSQKNLHCSFCGRERSEVNKLIQGPDVYICDECVELCTDILSEGESSPTLELENITPQIIKSYLDDYVIGQEDAKIFLSVAVYNHLNRIKNPEVDGVKLEKSNCLITGTSGSGKTLLVETIAKRLNLPYYIADATTLTESGYVGDDVQSILSGLILAADGNVEEAEKGIIFIDEIDKKSKKGENLSITRDVSGEGVQQALLKMIEGCEVRVSLQGTRKHPNADTVTIDTNNILFVVGGAFVGINDIIKKRLNKNKTSIGFNSTPTYDTEDDKNLISKIESEDFISYGIIPELVGRLPSIIYLNTLTRDQLIHVLTEPKNSIVKQYKSIFKLDGIDLELTNEVLEEIADRAISRNTGARGLRSIMDKYLTPLQYAASLHKANGITKITLKSGFFEGDPEAIELS